MKKVMLFIVCLCLCATISHAKPISETTLVDGDTIWVTGVYTVTDEEDNVSEKESVIGYTQGEIKANIERCDAIIEEYKQPGKFQAEHNRNCVKTEQTMWQKLDKEISDKKKEEITFE